MIVHYYRIIKIRLELEEKNSFILFFLQNYLDQNIPYGTAEEFNSKEKCQQACVLVGLDELGIIKQLIARDNPYILDTELPQYKQLPALPEGRVK